MVHGKTYQRNQLYEKKKLKFFTHSNPTPCYKKDNLIGCLCKTAPKDIVCP